MAFCPYKSLHFLLQDRDDDEEKRYHTETLIPEPALWSIFNDLVDACLLLQYGDVDGDEPVEGWAPIVHRDIKLDNVWLDSRNAKRRFPSYPTARLGDFGMAVMTDENDPNNPMAFNDGDGAHVWRAPEQLLFLDQQSLQPLPVKLGEKTNVWGIGAVMIRLMNHDADPMQPNFEDGKPYNLALEHRIRSDALEELVLECGRYNPAERPCLRVVKDRILENTTTDGVHDKADGMRDYIHDRGDANLTLHFPRDGYKIGMALPSRRCRR